MGSSKIKCFRCSKRGDKIKIFTLRSDSVSLIEQLNAITTNQTFSAGMSICNACRKKASTVKLSENSTNSHTNEATSYERDSNLKLIESDNLVELNNNEPIVLNDDMQHLSLEKRGEISNEEIQSVSSSEIESNDDSEYDAEPVNKVQGQPAEEVHVKIPKAHASHI